MTGRSQWDRPWQRFPESQPLPAEGGLATSRQRGAMAESWWSKRFVEVLDGYGLGTRMRRGRRYARTGQVLSLDVRPGQILSQVQGSRATPYLVTIEPEAISDASWARIDAALGSRVVFAARLLAGEVPGELEDVFAEAGTALLPRRWPDLRARCNCPDPENPCKHIAAALYLFADRLDEDPWLAITWRGRTRDQVLVSLVDITAHGGDGHAPTPVTLDDDDPALAVAPWWPLSPGATGGLDAGGSVDARGDAPDHLALLAGDRPDPPEAVLRRLGPFDSEVRAGSVTELLVSAYAVIVGDVRPSPDEHRSQR